MNEFLFNTIILILTVELSMAGLFAGLLCLGDWLIRKEVQNKNESVCE